MILRLKENNVEASIKKLAAAKLRFLDIEGQPLNGLGDCAEYLKCSDFGVQLKCHRIEREVGRPVTALTGAVVHFEESAKHPLWVTQHPDLARVLGAQPVCQQLIYPGFTGWIEVGLGTRAEDKLNAVLALPYLVEVHLLVV
jgi:hypothetical protein